MVDLLVSFFAAPAKLMLHSDLWGVIMLVVLVVAIWLGVFLKRYEKTSRGARISKNALLIAICFCAFIWLPVSVYMSALWVGGH